MGAESPIDYVAVLADLKGRRAAMDSAIAAIELIVAQLPSGAVSQRELVLSDDAFFGMSIPDAIRKFLKIAKKKKTAKEISDGLEAGGLEHTSKSFYNTVYTILNREWSKSDPEIVKLGDLWALAEWYPGRKFRKKAEAETETQDESEDLPNALKEIAGP
jgi:hypothetical protein